MAPVGAGTGEERVAVPPERDSDAQFQAQIGVARADFIRHSSGDRSDRGGMADSANRGYKMTCETSTIPKGVAARMSP
jgi:hypothetical protein